MKNKKNKKANLEKSKAMFLLVGFIMAVAFVITAFQWQSEKVLTVVKSENIEPPIEIYPITTTNDLVEKPKQKDEIVEVKKEIIDVILIDENVKEVTKKVMQKPNVKMPDNFAIIDEPEDDEDTIEIYVSDMPKYPGGVLALRRWIGRNINYPTFAKENRIQGTVYLRFEVKKDGSIGKIEIQKGVDTLLDDEAERVIKKLPNFKPGMQNGKKVNVWFSIPISFKLS